ncbi:MAG: hypothetical protein H7Z12_19925 [Rhodospirillaceae bacterium]|nr:hypothetical protein [Rhodospirillales bacterium]
MVDMAAVENAFAHVIERRHLRAVLIKDADAWAALYGELQDAYTRAFATAAQEALKDALDRMRDLPPGTFGQADATHIMGVLEGRLGAEALSGLVNGPVINLTDALMRLGAAEVGTSVGVDIAFGRPDFDALKLIQKDNLHWVANSWNARNNTIFRKALDDYFREGMTREQLIQRFAEEFPALAAKGKVYFELLADTAATKTREMGRVTGYERAGVEYVQIRAHLDHRTSEICRNMHGRVIPVRRLSDQRDNYLDAVRRGDVLGAKDAWAWQGDKAAAKLQDAKTKDIPANIASPPYHARCRTITVAYLPTSGAASEWERSTFDREPLSRKATAALIEHCKAASWRDAKSMANHYDKHGKALWGTREAYNAAAMDLIRRGDRDVYLSVRGGRLKALFVRPGASARKSAEFAVVDVIGQDIETLHRRRGALSTPSDDVQAIKQPARGITKWLSK